MAALDALADLRERAVGQFAATAVLTEAQLLALTVHILTGAVICSGRLMNLFSHAQHEAGNTSKGTGA